jgi:hypothetical protein
MIIPRAGFLFLLLGATLAASPAAVIERHGDEWILDTGLVRKVVRLDAGRLSLASFRNEASDREYVTAGQASPEFRFTADGVVVTGATGGWTLVGDQLRQLVPGEWQLDLKLRREAIEVEKHYVAYAGTPVIREWVTIANLGGQAVKIEEPCFLAANLLADEAVDLDLSYVTGGGQFQWQPAAQDRADDSRL